GLAQHARDEGARGATGRARGAVGDRDEVRLGGLETAHGLPQARGGVRVTGWEQLEGDRGSVDGGHGATASWCRRQQPIGPLPSVLAEAPSPLRGVAATSSSQVSRSLWMVRRA